MSRRTSKVKICVDCGSARFDRPRTPDGKFHCFYCRSKRAVFLDLKALAQEEWERQGLETEVEFDFKKDHEA